MCCKHCSTSALCAPWISVPTNLAAELLLLCYEQVWIVTGSFVWILELITHVERPVNVGNLLNGDPVASLLFLCTLISTLGMLPPGIAGSCCTCLPGIRLLVTELGICFNVISHYPRISQTLKLRCWKPAIGGCMFFPSTTARPNWFQLYSRLVWTYHCKKIKVNSLLEWIVIGRNMTTLIKLVLGNAISKIKRHTSIIICVIYDITMECS